MSDKRTPDEAAAGVEHKPVDPGKPGPSPQADEAPPQGPPPPPPPPPPGGGEGQGVGGG